MKVVEVRQLPGYTRRRYDNGSTTYEVPASVVRGIGMRVFKDSIARVQRGVAQRKRAADLRAAVKARPGVPAEQLGRELGCTGARVRQIRSEKQ